MDSKKLEILMTAAELGSFSKAAEIVGYTQSGLTHMMDALEKELGIPLLVRTHSGIKLTEQGEKLQPAIKEFLRANATLENQIQELVNTSNSTIRVAAYSSMAMQWLPEILYRFHRICPDAHVDLRMVDHALEPFELLEGGKTDVIFASSQNYSNIEWIPLYQEKMYAILPLDYPLHGRTSIDLKELATDQFIMPDGRFDIDIKRAFAKVGIQMENRAIHFDDETLIRMVSRNLGYTIMSELMIRGRTDDVLCVPIEPMTYRELGMGLPLSSVNSSSIQKLKDCSIQFVKEYTEKNKNIKK